MTIKEFCEKYNSISNSNVKQDFFKKNIKIKSYIPFVLKTTIANKIAQVSVLDEKTGNINLKSEINYLLFCRSLIENYTDLKIESKGFYEEYDLLNKNGILDEITKEIPEKEINEFKLLCDMKKNDIIFNMGTPKAYINQQVKRFSSLVGITLKPVIDKFSNELQNLDEEKVNRIIKVIDKKISKNK